MQSDVSTKSSPKRIFAIVGMPGSGKTAVATYLKEKGFPIVRFGKVTDDGLQEMGLPQTPDNERMFREQIRRDLGMEAYAIKSENAIKKLIVTHEAVIIDGLYSWEEYRYLSKRFPRFILIHIYAEPEVRYKRLAERQVRPFSKEQARERDIAEIENLGKSGPIAISDYLIDNNESFEVLDQRVDKLLDRIGIVAKI